MKHHSIKEVCQLTGLDEQSLSFFVQHEWIIPFEGKSPETTNYDEEDLARIRLILELRDSFGANEEAIPLILHLIDQLHYFRSRLGEFRN